MSQTPPPIPNHRGLALLFALPVKEANALFMAYHRRGMEVELTGSGPEIAMTGLMAVELQLVNANPAGLYEEARRAIDIYLQEWTRRH